LWGGGGCAADAAVGGGVVGGGSGYGRGGSGGSGGAPSPPAGGRPCPRRLHAGSGPPPVHGGGLAATRDRLAAEAAALSAEEADIRDHRRHLTARAAAVKRKRVSHDAALRDLAAVTTAATTASTGGNAPVATAGVPPDPWRPAKAARTALWGGSSGGGVGPRAPPRL